MARSKGRFGPPRKADHRTGASAAFARAVAASLPGVESQRDRDDTTFSVDGQAFLSVEDSDAALVWTAAETEERLALLALGRDEVRARIEHAWQSYASKQLVSVHRSARTRWSRQRAVTCDDIRRVIETLPGANEGPIWGQDLGFRVGDEKRTRFARFGPPEGSKIGNLLPPDDENALVIFHCETKPALLASCAERFFTTPHYGNPDEPGGIITRLGENRGKAHLAELAELLEAAWRRVAGPEHLAERERPRGKASEARSEPQASVERVAPGPASEARSDAKRRGGGSRQAALARGPTRRGTGPRKSKKR